MHSYDLWRRKKDAAVAKLKRSTLADIKASLCILLDRCGFSLENPGSHIVWPAGSLRLADAATAARNADCICVPAHNAARARTYSLARRRYGGANCNLCLIAVIVGTPRQRELRRRRPFLHFKAFQEGTVPLSFAAANTNAVTALRRLRESRRIASRRFD